MSDETSNDRFQHTLDDHTCNCFAESHEQLAEMKKCVEQFLFADLTIIGHEERYKHLNKAIKIAMRYKEPEEFRDMAEAVLTTRHKEPEE